MKQHILLLIGFAGIFIFLASCGKIEEIEIRGADNFKYKGFKDNHIELEADINIYNPSGFKIRIKEIDMRLVVNNEYLGRLYNSGDIVIRPHSEGYITVPFRLRITNIFAGVSAVKKYYNQKNLKVEVDGTVTGRAGIIRKKIGLNKTAYIDSLKP
ncbi:MAG: LEA type 2 family protein [Bacteroidales bacterium]|nr:LEA type 2 family protein [Bacteroidales bacterium]